MRVGVSSRGNAWMSLGCFGWLILGPFILTGILVWAVAMLLWQLGVWLWGVAAAR